MRRHSSSTTMLQITGFGTCGCSWSMTKKDDLCLKKAYRVRRAECSPMNKPRLQLAYRLYCEEGRPEGKVDEHWSRAEREVRGKTSSANFESSQAEASTATARAGNPPL